MSKKKWFAKSKSLWGIVIILWPMIAPTFGLDPTFDMVDVGDTLHSSANKIIQAIGALVVVWGRLTASSDLTLKR